MKCVYIIEILKIGRVYKCIEIKYNIDINVNEVLI